jgi:hypothetical protein
MQPEFDALLEAQRAEDERKTGTEQTGVSKRKRDVMTDHEYRLRKERTDGLLTGYQNVLLRRSPRLREKLVPDDFAPLPSSIDRGDDSDDDDPESDLQMGRVERRFGDLDIAGGEMHNGSKRVILTIRQIRRIMAARESLF